MSTIISDAICIPEATCFGIDIFRYAPKSKPARQYENLALEMVERLEETCLGPSIEQDLVTGAITGSHPRSKSPSA